MMRPLTPRTWNVFVESLRVRFGVTRIYPCTVIPLMTVVILGCEDRTRGSSSMVSSNSTATPASRAATGKLTDQWLGKWIGPEGTYLLLSNHGAGYLVEINSLDGLATYEGTSVGDHIDFQRNGKTESIRAGSGQETGMKWLLDKKNCLIIRTGEGFCRE
jgi:hypothetical protein